MIRARAVGHGFGRSETFRWRGHEVSRIEGLSDAVFAFAVTLLVVALEVPQTFGELADRMRDFLGFAMSFALLFQVWFYQYIYFRRYGLQNGAIIWLNAFLLFLVVFYVYPLKFLTTMLSRLILTGGVEFHLPDGHTAAMVTPDQVPTLMLIYGAGTASVFAVFFVLYWHAYRRRDALDLNPLEQAATRDSMRECFVFIAVALLSMSVAAVGGKNHLALAGSVYLLLAPVQFLIGMYARRQRGRLMRQAIAGRPGPGPH